MSSFFVYFHYITFHKKAQDDSPYIAYFPHKENRQKKFAFPIGLWYNKSYCAVMAVTFDTSLSAGSGKDIIILNKAFRKGVLQGIPIALGYLSVSFGFGILAVRAGLSIPAAVAISVTNVTSAGQAAGVGVIAAGGSYLEMALTQLTINFRYALMGFSLSQKLDEKFHLPQRMTTAFGITDEIFAVASSQPGMICPAYLYGLIAIAFLGWVLGTLLGAAAGQILPKFIIDAMGIVLYGMFLAIIVPVARKKKSVLTVVILAALCSILFKYVFTAVSSESDTLYCHYGWRDLSHSGSAVYRVPEEDPEPFPAKLSLLHSLCGAECHDHSGNLLLHGQHGDCGGGNRRCGRAGLLQPAADRGSTCSIGSSAGDRIPGISACSISKKHILCVQSAYGGFFRVCHT